MKRSPASGDSGTSKLTLPRLAAIPQPTWRRTTLQEHLGDAAEAAEAADDASPASTTAGTPTKSILIVAIAQILLPVASLPARATRAVSTFNAHLATGTSEAASHAQRLAHEADAIAGHCLCAEAQCTLDPRRKAESEEGEEGRECTASYEWRDDEHEHLDWVSLCVVQEVPEEPFHMSVSA